MKIIISISFAFLLLGCQKTKSQKEENLSPLINCQLGEQKTVNTKIIDIANSYLDSVNYDKKRPVKVCRLFLEQKGMDIRFKIGSVRYLSTVKEDLPFGYIESGDIVILIYTGLEFFYKKEKSVPVSLNTVLKNKLINDLLPDLETINPDISPTVSSSPTWECVLLEDSVGLISRNAEPVSRFKTILVPAVPNKNNINDTSIDSSTINSIHRLIRLKHKNRLKGE